MSSAAVVIGALRVKNTVFTPSIGTGKPEQTVLTQIRYHRMQFLDTSTGCEIELLKF